MGKPDLEQIRKLARHYDEAPPVVIRPPPRWYHRPSIWIILILLALILYFATADGAVDPARPVFHTAGGKQIATMDRAFCWKASFTNVTKGLTHTLTTAKDKYGKYCPRVEP